MGGNNEFFENFERNKYLKKLPSMQRVNKVRKNIKYHLSSGDEQTLLIRLRR